MKSKSLKINRGYKYWRYHSSFHYEPRKDFGQSGVFDCFQGHKKGFVFHVHKKEVNTSD